MHANGDEKGWLRRQQLGSPRTRRVVGEELEGSDPTGKKLVGGREQFGLFPRLSCGPQLAGNYRFGGSTTVLQKGQVVRKNTTATYKMVG